MIKKSRLAAFILSFIPGGGHFYLGFPVRGIVFFISTFVDVVFSFGLAVAVQDEDPLVLLIALPFIWLWAALDSIYLADRINRSVEAGLTQSSEAIPSVHHDEYRKKQNTKAIAMFLSVVPGAGHMYLGFQKQGFQLMLMFFTCIFLVDWLRTSLFMVFLPAIWFYGMFDAMYKASGEEVDQNKDVMMISWFNGNASWMKDKSKLLGYLLVFLGSALILARIVFPIIDREISWEIRGYLQNGIIALLFILGGIKLLTGSKGNSAGGKGESGL